MVIFFGVASAYALRTKLKSSRILLGKVVVYPKNRSTGQGVLKRVGKGKGRSDVPDIPIHEAPGKD